MFKGRHFDRSVILLCIRWYLAYNLSLHNLEEMMADFSFLFRICDRTVLLPRGRAGSAGTYSPCQTMGTNWKCRKDPVG